MSSLMTDEVSFLLEASSTMSAEEDLVLRHMCHGVRDQESANCVIVGAVTPSASGVVELDSGHWKTDVVVVDVRLEER